MKKLMELKNREREINDLVSKLENKIWNEVKIESSCGLVLGVYRDDKYEFLINFKSEVEFEVLECYEDSKPHYMEGENMVFEDFEDMIKFVESMVIGF